MVEKNSTNRREETINELNRKIKEIESLLMDLEKISGKLLGSPIKKEERDMFSKMIANIYYTRDEYANGRDDIYKEINREKRKDRKNRKKEFLKEMSENKE